MKITFDRYTVRETGKRYALITVKVWGRKRPLICREVEL